MAMMTPANLIAHIGEEVARKFANDILNLLGTAKPEAEEKAKPKPKPKAKPKEEIEEKK